MPRRNDIHKILVIGSGPIVIGQGAEFDYSGTQATKALREEGYEVVLVNSNPATIMTDPETADSTYIEPVTPEVVEQIIIKERPDALLPTMGGQTALNVAMALAESGVLAAHGVELIGANARAIAIAEDRKLFNEAMGRIGLQVAQGAIATHVRRGDGDRRVDRLPGDHPPVVHARRHRRRHRVQPRRSSRRSYVAGCTKARRRRCSSSGASSAGRSSSSR